jgi:hypothetical protein
MHAMTAGGLSNGAADPSRILRIAGLSSTSQLIRGFNPKYFPTEVVAVGTTCRRFCMT